MASETIFRVFDIDPKQAPAPAIAVFVLLAIFAVLHLADCHQWNWRTNDHLDL
jgi:hypothetical protein